MPRRRCSAFTAFVLVVVTAPSGCFGGAPGETTDAADTATAARSGTAPTITTAPTPPRLDPTAPLSTDVGFVYDASGTPTEPGVLPEMSEDPGVADEAVQAQAAADAFAAD